MRDFQEDEIAEAPVYVPDNQASAIPDAVESELLASPLVTGIAPTGSTENGKVVLDVYVQGQCDIQSMPREIHNHILKYHSRGPFFALSEQS